jgi:hypothetical protein
MSQRTTLPTPKGLSRTTVTIIVTLLLSLLAVSLFFNILSYTSNPHPPVNVQIVSLNWIEYKISTENNLYLVLVNLTLRNPDPRYAEVQVQYIMHDSDGELTLEPSPINTTTGTVWRPTVGYLTSYGLGPNMSIICGFSFYYLKPQNTTTQLSAEIAGKIPIV